MQRLTASRKTKPAPAPEIKTQPVKTLVTEEIEIPTLMGKSLSVRTRNRSNSSIAA
jgi:hypothetical protein